MIQSPETPYVTYILDTPQDWDGRIGNLKIDDCHICTLLEARTTIGSGSTGLRTWIAGFVLADYLIQNWSEFT